MKQGTQSFASYLAEFERTLLDADGGDWPEHVKKAFLDNGISNDLHKAMVASSLPDTYQEYCSVLQTVSYNLEALRTRERRDASRAFPTARTAPPRPVAELSEGRMDWEPTPTAQVAATQ